VGWVARCSSPTVTEGSAYEVAARWSEPSLTVGLLHRATRDQPPLILRHVLHFFVPSSLFLLTQTTA